MYPCRRKVLVADPLAAKAIETTGMPIASTRSIHFDKPQNAAIIDSLSGVRNESIYRAAVTLARGHRYTAFSTNRSLWLFPSTGLIGFPA